MIVLLVYYDCDGNVTQGSSGISVGGSICVFLPEYERSHEALIQYSLMYCLQIRPRPLGVFCTIILYFSLYFIFHSFSSFFFFYAILSRPPAVFSSHYSSTPVSSPIKTPRSPSPVLFQLPDLLMVGRYPS